MISRETLAGWLRDYLQHRITRANLVDRAEHAMVHSQFEENGFDTIRDIPLPALVWQTLANSV
jgi:hypothetical protein